MFWKFADFIDLDPDPDPDSSNFVDPDTINPDLHHCFFPININQIDLEKLIFS